MGKPRKYTDAQLLDAIRSAAAELGRPPYKGETMPSATAIVHRFGSWSRAVYLAGLSPRRGKYRPRTTQGGIPLARQGKSRAIIARESRAGRRALTLARQSSERREAIAAYWLAHDPTLRTA